MRFGRIFLITNFQYTSSRNQESRALLNRNILKNLLARETQNRDATCASLYPYCFPGRRISEGNAPFASCQNEIPKMFRVNVSQKCHRALIEYIAFAFAPREMLTFASGRLEFSAHSDTCTFLIRRFTISQAPSIDSKLIKLNRLMTVNAFSHTSNFRIAISFTMYRVSVYITNLQFTSSYIGTV